MTKKKLKNFREMRMDDDDDDVVAAAVVISAFLSTIIGRPSHMKKEN